MPHLKPLNWYHLFFFFILVFMTMMMFMYFFFLPSTMILSKQKFMHFWSWKWQ